MSKNCNCATCIACTCTQHRCDVRAARRGQSQNRKPELHYTPDQLTSVNSATYRPPTRDELRNASAVAGKPEWSQITKACPAQPFEGKTTTQETYRGQQNPRPQTSNERPFFDRGDGNGNSGGRPQIPFEAKSAYADQFHEHNLAEARATRTVPTDRDQQSHFELHPRGARFDGNTTNRQTFRGDQPARSPPQQPPPPREPPPKLKFDAVSVTKEQFTPKQRDPTQPLGHRHPDNQEYLPTNVKFQGETETHDTYRGLQPPPSRPAPSVPLPQRQSLPFEGESQSHADYKRYRDVPPPSRAHPDVFRSHFNQPGELYGGTGKGEYETETRGQFQGRAPPPCPAAAWATPIPTPTGYRTPNNY